MSVAVIEKNSTVDVIAVHPPADTGTTAKSEAINTGAIIVGSRIWVTSYCPFRGFRGTILGIHLLEDPQIETKPDELPYGVYKIQLDGVPAEIEFQSDDIDLLTPIVIRE